MNDPVFFHFTVFINIKFLTEIFGGRMGRKDFDYPIRRTEAPRFINFIRITNYADVWLNYRVDVLVPPFFGFRKSYIKRSREHFAFLSLEEVANLKSQFHYYALMTA